MKKMLLGTVALICGGTILSANGSAAGDAISPPRAKPVVDIKGTAPGKISNQPSPAMYRALGMNDDGAYRDDDRGVVADAADFQTPEFEASPTPGQINAQAAYAEGVFGKGVTIGVIDEDFDLDHPDLADNITGFFDVTAGNRAGQQDPDNADIADVLQSLDDLIEDKVEGGHGTNVTGVIAAARNGEGIQGVAPDASLIAIRADRHDIELIENEDDFDASAALDYVINPADADDASQARVINILDENGEIDQDKALEVLVAIEDEDFDVVGAQRGSFADADIAKGVDTAVQQHADIINLSLGSSDEGFDDTATDALIRATDSHRIVVIANGNENRTDDEGDPLETLPDSDPTAQIAVDPRTNGLVLAVGVVDENNEIRFNNCGTSKDRCLVAPGIDITTTDNGGGFDVLDGSSFSTPAVSGSLALLLELFPTLDPKNAVDILLASATDLGEDGVDEVFGHGLVNIQRAVQPIGVASLPTDGNINGGTVTLASSTLGLSGAFGDAFSNVPALQNGLFLDGFRRPFKADLQQRVVASSRIIDFDRAFASSGIQTKSFSGPDGFNVSLSLREDRSGGFDLPPSQVGFAQAAYERDDRLQSLKFGGEIADGLVMSAGHNLTAGQQLNVDPVSASASKLFLFTDDSLSPQHAFLGKGSGASFTQALSEKTSFSLGLLRVTDDEGEGFTTEASLRHLFDNDGQLGLSVSFTDEASGFLGSEAGGAFASKAETSSLFYTLSGSLPLAATIELLGSATLGVSDLSGVNGGILSGVDRVVSDAFALGVKKSHIFDTKDRIGLMVSQPLRVESGGSATFLVPTAVNADGSIVSTSSRVGLTPSGRETNLQLAYSRELASNMDVTAYALVRDEPGHDEDAARDLGVGMQLKVAF